MLPSQLNSLVTGFGEEFWKGVIGYTGTRSLSCCSKGVYNARKVDQEKLCEKIDELISQIECVKGTDYTYVLVTKSNLWFSTCVVDDKGEYVIDDEDEYIVFKLDDCIIKRDPDTAEKYYEISQVTHYDNLKNITPLEGKRILRSNNKYCQLALNNGGSLFYGLLGCC